MRSIDKCSKIAIIGAGIAGPALAISLKKYGF
jgi:2-polyprenyl-6-methoxyphenol hydroxylase-like FAD-dependent oxidoreductase